MKLSIIVITLTMMTSYLIGQSESQRQIPSTNIYMNTPEGFTNSENFKGLQNPDDPYSMIMVTEMPAPYEELVKGFTEDLMNPQGMTLTKKEERTVGANDGVYIEMLHNAGGVVFKKAMLIYGDADKTTLINGMCLEENSATFESISKSIGEAFIKSDLVIDQRAALDFSVNEEGLDLVFISVIGNGMLFNRDGLMPTESSDKLNVIIDKSFADVETSNKNVFIVQRLAQFPGEYEYDEEAGISSIEIDGLDGRSLMATSAEGEKMNQVVLFMPEGGYYIYAALYKDGEEKAKIDAERLLKTFKQK